VRCSSVPDPSRSDTLVGDLRKDRFTMRWLVIATAASIAFIVFVVVAATRSDSEGTFYGFKEHPPRSDQEKLAAGVAVAYFRGLVRERPDEVCRTVSEPLTSLLRCETEPRIPGKLQVAADGHRLRVTHISLDATDGHAWISGISPGPAQDVALRRVQGSWRVVANHAFGLA
jgi:hypothetical protein